MLQHSFIYDQLRCDIPRCPTVSLCRRWPHPNMGQQAKCGRQICFPFADARHNGMNAVQHGSLLRRKSRPLAFVIALAHFFQEMVGAVDGNTAHNAIVGGTGTPESLQAWRRHALLDGRRTSCVFVRGNTHPQAACLRHTSPFISPASTTSPLALHAPPPLGSKDSHVLSV